MKKQTVTECSECKSKDIRIVRKEPIYQNNKMIGYKVTVACNVCGKLTVGEPL